MIDTNVQDAYQNYITHLTKYEIDHGYKARHFMKVEENTSTHLGDHRVRPLYIDEFIERCNKEPQFRRTFYEAAGPSPLSDIDWSGVKSLAEGIVDEVLNGTYHEDNDDEHYIYEEVMTAVYGENFWKWFNSNV